VVRRLGIGEAAECRQTVIGDRITNGWRVPNVIITDKLRRYSAAKAEVLPSVNRSGGREL
jgi:hypothetical protein